MSEHTPGPWKVFAKNSVIEVQDASGWAVIPWPGFDDGDRPVKERLANAKLIARAPKLLDENTQLRARIAELEAQLNVATHTKADDQVGFDWEILTRIAALEAVQVAAAEYLHVTHGSRNVIEQQKRGKLIAALDAAKDGE